MADEKTITEIEKPAIAQKQRQIIVDAKYEDFEVLKKSLGDAVYDDVEKKLTFNVKEFKGKGWRLVHDGSRVITMFEATDDDDTTSTPYTLFVGTEKECLDEIKRLNLEYTPEEIE